MKDRPLVGVSETTDYDSEMWAGDVVTFWTVHGALDDFLRKRGRDGRNRVLLNLTYLVQSVRRRYDDLKAAGKIEVDEDASRRETGAAANPGGSVCAEVKRLEERCMRLQKNLDKEMVRGRNVQADGLDEYDLRCERWREYRWSGCDEPYCIEYPQTLVVVSGGTMHKVVGKNGVTHCVPAPGERGCVLRWKNKVANKPGAF